MRCLDVRGSVNAKMGVKRGVCDRDLGWEGLVVGDWG